MTATSFDPDIDLYPTPDYDEVIGTLRSMLDPKEFDRMLNIIENDLCLYFHALGDIESLERLYGDMNDIALHVDRLRFSMNHTISEVIWRIRRMNQQQKEEEKEENDKKI